MSLLLAGGVFVLGLGPPNGGTSEASSEDPPAVTDPFGARATDESIDPDPRAITPEAAFPTTEARAPRPPPPPRSAPPPPPPGAKPAPPPPPLHVARDQPKWDGTHMLAWAGAFSAFGLGMNAFRAVLGMCNEFEEDLYCENPRLGAHLLFGLPAAGFNAIAAGFAAGGADLRRRYDDWRVATRGAQPRDTRKMFVTGYVLLGLGVAGGVVGWPMLVVVDSNAELVLQTVGLQLSAMLAASGAGLLSYARDPKPRRRKRSFHAAPILGHDLGLAIGGTF